VARAYPSEGGGLAADTLHALVEQTGIIRVDTLSQQLDVARVLACQPLPAGGRVALVGNGGGSLALAADACVDAGLTLAAVGPGVAAAVGEGAVADGAVAEGAGSGVRLRASTVDLGFEATAADLTRAVRALLADDGVDSVLVVCAPAPRQPTSDLVRAVAEAAPDATGKTLLACVFGPHPVTIPASGEGARDVPVFDFPDDAAYALGRVTRYARWRARPEGALVEPDGADPDAARPLVVEALADRAAAAAPGDGGDGGDGGDDRDDEAGDHALPIAVTVELLTVAGLPMVPSRVAPDADAAAGAAARLGYPVAVKTVSRSRLAKSEAGGLALDVQDETDLRATLARMAGSLGAGAWPVVVQPMAVPGVDVAVGVAQNPLVGPVLSLGPGGVATQLSAARAHVLPMTDLDARRFVAESPLADLLEPTARARLEDLLLRVGGLVDAVPEITALELNPVIVSPGTAAIVDAWVRAAPVDHSPAPPVRRL
jgi:acyl-CoA synthetase (NDP forming)